MTNLTTLTGTRPHETLGRLPRRTGLRRAFGVILLAALLHQPGQVRSAVVPNTYSVGMAWDRSSSAGVAGYRLHYGTGSRNYTNSTTVGDVTSSTVSGLTGGVTYFFAITAVDADGLESGYSSEISYVPGLPGLRLQITPARQAVLTVSGLIGRAYEIQAKSQAAAWTAIGTVTLGTNGSAVFTDPGAANLPGRLYRTRTLP